MRSDGLISAPALAGAGAAATAAASIAAGTAAVGGGTTTVAPGDADYQAGKEALARKDYAAANARFTAAAKQLNINALVFRHVFLRDGLPKGAAFKVVDQNPLLAEQLALMVYLIPVSPGTTIPESSLTLPKDEAILDCWRKLKPLISLEGFQTYDQLLELVSQLYLPTFVNTFNQTLRHLEVELYGYFKSMEAEAKKASQQSRRSKFMSLVIHLAEEANDERALGIIRSSIERLLAKSKSECGKRFGLFSRSNFVDKMVPLCELILSTTNALAVHCAAKVFLARLKLEAESQATASSLLNMAVSEEFDFDDSKTAATYATARTAKTHASHALTAKTAGLLKASSFKTGSMSAAPLPKPREAAIAGAGASASRAGM